MMMQLLAKVDLKHTCLKNLGQWQNSNPDNQIAVLQAKVDHLSKIVYNFKTHDNTKAGTKTPVIPCNQTAECPT